MRLYFDENFPKSGHELAERRGIECFDHRGTELEGIADSGLFDLAQQREAVLVTTDRDFYHTIPILRPEHFGILVIALKQPNRANILSRFTWALDHFEPEEFKNRAFSLRDSTWSARPPLDKEIPRG